MSDAPASAPSAPAPSAPTAAPSAPQGGAAPVHHAHLQPREQGKFAGPPDTSKVPAVTPPPAAEPPKAWKVGQREFKTPEELALYAQEADAERGALDTYRKQAAEHAAKVREYEERLKDPSKLVTEEMRRRYVMEEVQRFQEAQALEKMDPQTRQLYLMAKENERKAAEMEAKVREYETQQAEAKRKQEEEAKAKADAAARDEVRALIGGALQAVGLPTEGFAGILNIQRAAMVLKGAAENGIVYQPEVVAKKVRDFVHRERDEYVSAMKPAELLANPKVVDALNGLDDASLLRALAPLGEKLRRLHLQSIGATPTPAPTPVATGPRLVADEVDTSKLAPGDSRWNEVLERRLRG